LAEGKADGCRLEVRRTREEEFLFNDGERVVRFLREEGDGMRGGGGRREKGFEFTLQIEEGGVGGEGGAEGGQKQAGSDPYRIRPWMMRDAVLVSARHV
jgi:hypothetical protein